MMSNTGSAQKLIKSFPLHYEQIKLQIEVIAFFVILNEVKDLLDIMGDSSRCSE